MAKFLDISETEGFQLEFEFSKFLLLSEGLDLRIREKKREIWNNLTSKM